MLFKSKLIKVNTKNKNKRTFKENSVKLPLLRDNGTKVNVVEVEKILNEEREKINYSKRR